MQKYLAKIQVVGEFLPIGAQYYLDHIFHKEISTNELPNAHYILTESGEELYYNYATVIWSKGSRVLKTMTQLDFKPISQAFFCYFKNEKCIAFSTNESLKIFLPDGKETDLNFSFPIQTCYPLKKNGILLQKRYQQQTLYSQCLYYSFYYLSDPLAELKLVECESLTESVSVLFFQKDWVLIKESYHGFIYRIEESSYGNLKLKKNVCLWKSEKELNCFIQIVNDIEGKDLLVVFSRTLKRIDFYDAQTFKFKFHFENISACSSIKSCTRPHLIDLLYLTADHQFYLWNGIDQSIACEWDFKVDRKTVETEHAAKKLRESTQQELFSSPLNSKPEFDKEWISHHKVLQLKDPVGNYLNLVLSNGTSIRAKLDFQPKSILVQRLLSCVADHFNHSEKYYKFYNTWVQLLHSTLAVNHLPSQLLSSEFSSFCAVLFCLLFPPNTLKLPQHYLEKDSDEDWHFLLQTLKKTQISNFINLEEEMKVNQNDELIQILKFTWKYLGPFDFPNEQPAQLFLHLHFFYEQLKLKTSFETREVENLALLLHQLSILFGWQNIMNNYYILDFPDILSFQMISGSDNEHFSISAPFDEPPSILETIKLYLKTGEKNSYWKVFEKKEAFIFQFLELLKHQTNDLELISNFVDLLQQHKMQKGNLEEFQYPLLVPIYHMIEKCQQKPQKSWNSETFKLIQRLDLFQYYDKNSDLRKNSKKNQKFQLNDYASSYNQIQAELTEKKKVVKKETVDSLFFTSDFRLEEICKLIEIPDYIPIHHLEITSGAEQQQQEIQVMQQNFLLKSANRIFSFLFAQSMIYLDSKQPTLSKSFDMPKLKIKGKVLETKTSVQLDLSAVSGNFMEWPEFHSGVASCLKLERDHKEIDGSWIVYNRKEEPDAQHAGFLFGLGLLGYLKKLEHYHWFEYLNVKHDLTSIGLLLGLSCSYFGSKDEKVTNLLSLHIPSLLPPHSTDLNHSSVLQQAALMSLGILYFKSANKRMISVLMNEMQRRSPVDSEAQTVYGESFSLSAGVGLGFLTCGLGRHASETGDLSLANQLIAMIKGSEDGTFESGEFFDGAAPAALVALGLMFLKSNDEQVAQMLQIPQTPMLMEAMRPDLLLLIVITRHLIMWDQIEPSINWLEHNFPSFMQQTRKFSGWFSIIAGCCFVMGLKMAGSNDQQTKQTLFHYLNLCQNQSHVKTDEYDSKMMKFYSQQAQFCILTALSLVTAGRGDVEVVRQLRKLLIKPHFLSYGDYWSVSSSLGLCFLGRGYKTLKTDHLSIACLYCSLFPRFPVSVTDHRTLLQALRHLWIFAVDHRAFLTVDVDSDEDCSVSCLVYLRNSSRLIVETPCLLPELEDIQKLEFKNREYFDLSFDMDEQLQKWIRHGKRIPLQRQKNIQTTNLYMKTFPTENDLFKNDLKETEMSPLFKEFFNHFCQSEGNDSENDLINQSLLKWSISRNRAEWLQLYLQAQRDLNLVKEKHSTFALQRLLLFLHFSEWLEPTFVSHLKVSLSRYFE